MRIPTWQWTAGVLLVTSLTGCGTVSEKWSQWRGKSVTAAAISAPAPAQRLQPTTERGRWDGVYRATGDLASFQECQTGQTIPVQLSGDSALLESAYLAARTGADRSMLATVDGTIVEEAAADPVLAQRGQKQLALRVERFVSLSSTASCAGGKAVALGAPALPAADAAAVAASLKAASEPAAAPVSAAPADASDAAAPTAPASPLSGTYWKLRSLQGEAVPATPKEAHIILQAQGKLAGAGPCNRLMGSWNANAQSLRFSKVGTTRMACRGDAQAVESGLIKVLGQTAHSRISGPKLELLNAQNQVLAVFDAVALR